MELLSKCPCGPIVRHGSPAPHPKIVAAVNASTEETEEQALNAKIVELTLLMASHLDASSPRVLQAWAPFAEATIPQPRHGRPVCRLRGRCQTMRDCRSHASGRIVLGPRARAAAT
jgi:hypothetical protein